MKITGNSVFIKNYLRKTASLFMKKYTVIFLALLAAGLHVRAQVNSTLADIVNSYTRYAQHHLREKVYLHTDRHTYLCGNILWFKAYVVNAIDNKPLNLSKVVYVELVNKNGLPELQAKISVSDDGTGSGSFDLPFTLESGNYELKAYTNFMKNDTTLPFFYKTISILNTTKGLGTDMIGQKRSYRADFFPEGGNLVNGLTSVVGFKINDNSGAGVSASGLIIDNNQDTLLNFKTMHYGMGTFSFTPQAGKTYTAIITAEDDSVIKKMLPEAYSNGLVMHLNDQDDKQLTVSVNASDPALQNLFVIVQAKEHIEYAKVMEVHNGSGILPVDKSSLAEGISVITLFDGNRRPVAERLYFKKPMQRVALNAGTDKSNYHLRDKVDVSLSPLTDGMDTLHGNLSLSVYRTDQLNNQETDDIVSYLWLSSDIKGYIEDPGYYFRNNDKETLANLDMLLLTQGWRTFSWDNIFNRSSYASGYVPENYGHLVRGRITNTATGLPVADKTVYFSVPGKRVQLYVGNSDQNGLFYFNTKDLYTDGQVVLQADAGKDSLYRIELFSPFSEKGIESPLPSLFVPESMQDDITRAYVNMQVERVYHENELDMVKEAGTDTLPFYYRPTATYLLDNYTRFVTMEEVMREYVREVNVAKKGNRYRFLTMNSRVIALSDIQEGEKIFSKDPLVLLDGVPVFDINKIVAYDPLKVQKLEVVASRYFYGPVTAEGIVSYTTYKGNLDGFTLDPKDVILNYQGLQEQRIFYSPDYSGSAGLQSRLPDMREVLYWNPSVKTAGGDHHESFYTGDVAGKYVGIVQGISENGLPVAASFIFEVNNH